MTMMRKTKMLLAGGAAAAVLIGGGVGVAYAANDSSSGSAADALPSASQSTASSTPTSGSAQPGPSGKAGKGGKAKRRKDLRDRVEHGEFTVRAKGGEKVMDLQHGTVVSASASGLQVKSADGFTASYVVNSDTKVRKGGTKAAIGDVHSGDPVAVVATKSGTTSGSTLTATAIQDRQK